MDYKVFVSSTLTDLANHREAVRAGIQQLGARDIAMETFGARDERPKDECIRLVREECDFFLGIYAHRYGFIPKGDRISITETEYIAASKFSKPRLIYLVNPSAPWSPPHIDRGQSVHKLANFKKRLAESHICNFFTTPDELRAYVSADLGREILRKRLPAIGMRGRSEVAQLELPDRIDEWNDARYGVYKNQRDIFLVHCIAPSKVTGQRFDCFIYLARHKSDNLSEVKQAEFFLGPYWRNRVFRVKNSGGPIGIRVLAHGTFLCMCCITFNDGKQVLTSRYIDFAAEAPRFVDKPSSAKRHPKPPRPRLLSDARPQRSGSRSAEE